MTADPSQALPEFVIHRGRISDIESILAIAEASPAAAHWSWEEYATGCTPSDAADGMVKALFVASTPPLDAVFGFAAFTAVPAAGEYELANMAVAADRQRRGIGRRLIAAGLTWCRSWGPVAAVTNAAATRGLQFRSNPSLWLEVRASNRAGIAFYEHSGFAAVGIRTNYYDRPKEDAILMRKHLSDRPISGKLPQ